MITIFKTGDVDYTDLGIDKPVRYDMDNLIEVASRTSTANITKEHISGEVIGVMSNFIVKNGLLQAEEPENLSLKGMGFSPVFNFDLMDMGDYYKPYNIKMTEIGYTKNPRSRIVYNSIKVPNGESTMDDTEYQKLVKRNNDLQEKIGVLNHQIKQKDKKLKDKDDEIQELKNSYKGTDDKLKEYDKLKEIETNYNKLISSKRDDLIYKICGKDEKKAEKFKDYSIEQLETTVDLLKGQGSGGKGVPPQGQPLDRTGNDPTHNDEDEDEEYTDEMFEEDFKNSGL